jgi:biopolymer transport protein ExbD
MTGSRRRRAIGSYTMAIPSLNQHGGIFASINITPLTDIFLVLLIIFMVATSVTLESAARVDVSRVQAPSTSQPPKSVTVSYTATHQIFLDSKPLTEDQLGPALTDALAHAPDKLVVFDGDPRVILGDMVRILDIARSAGANRVALAVTDSASGSASSGAPLPPAPEPESVAPARAHFGGAYH